jgi:hypothetical protein
MKKPVKLPAEKGKTKKDIEKQEPIQPVAAEVSLSFVSEPLMPELEELVKKNPNRLIGCGG